MMYVYIHSYPHHQHHSTYLRDQNPIAGTDAHGDALALPAEGAGADSQDLGLVELLDARLGQEDAGGGLGLGLDALHEHPVQQGDEGLDRSEGGGGLFFFLDEISQGQFFVFSCY